MGSRASAIKTAAQRTGCTVEEWEAKRAAGLLWCFGCREWLPTAAFHTDNSRTSKKAGRCRDCMSIAVAATRYGLTKIEVEALLAAGCSICGRRENLVIDHDHGTGKTRAALCSRCNVGLGLFLDKPDLLRAAVAYLEAMRLTQAGPAKL